MRLLHAAPVYAPAWSYGGTVRSVTAIAEAVASLGVHVTVVTTTVGTQLHSVRKPIWRELNGVEVCYCPGRVTTAGTWSSMACRVLKHHAAVADVAHLTSCWVPFGIPALRAFQRCGIPFVSSPRGCLNRESFGKGWWKKWPYYHMFERRIQDRAAVLHATSTLEAEELSHYFPYKQIATIPNMCSPDQWFPDPTAGANWRRKHGVPTGVILALYVGRIEPTKNLSFLARVARALGRHRPVQVVMIGPAEPRERARVLAAFSTDGVDPPRMLAGTGDDGDLRAAYCAADVFVLPSHHENFSNVLLEAAMCGTPVVASPKVGVVPILANLGCAQVVELKPLHWAAAVLSCADRRLAPSVVADARGMFSPLRVARSFYCLYQALLSQQSVP